MKASENAKAARGRKEGSRPFLASMRASLPPYNLVPRAFPSENGGGGGVQHPHHPIIKENPNGPPQVILPKHLPPIVPSRVLVPAIYLEARTFVPKLNKTNKQTTIIIMVCVQKSPTLALLHQQRKYKTLSISTAQVLSRRGP